MKQNYSFKNLIFLSIAGIIILAASINFYVANIGVFPLDTFLFFDTGYRILLGDVPFKDYWASTGPIIDYLQGLFFLIFGVNWFAYVLHSTILNVIVALFSFYLFNYFKTNFYIKNFFVILICLTAYPSSAVPSLDHHGMIISFISLFTFILAIKKDENKLWLSLPFLLFISFFSKQTPAGYFIILISIFFLIHLYFYFSFKRIFLVFISILICLLILGLFLFLNDISFEHFIIQYLLYPQSIAGSRWNDFVHPIEFNRYFLRFKEIWIPILILFFLLMSEFKKKNIYNIKNILIQLLLIFSGIIMIWHQILSLNQKFIFLTVPFLFYFVIYFLSKIKFKNNLNTYLILGFCFFWAIDNLNKYTLKRKFMDLEKVNLQNSLDANLIDKKLNGLKWITSEFEVNPNNEINLINKHKKELNQNLNTMLITHYQFIAPLLNFRSHGINRAYDDVSSPRVNSKYSYNYKIFINNHLKNKKIERIVIIGSLEDKIITEFLDKNCFKLNSEDNFYKEIILNLKCFR